MNSTSAVVVMIQAVSAPSTAGAAPAGAAVKKRPVKASQGSVRIDSMSFSVGWENARSIAKG